VTSINNSKMRKIPTALEGPQALPRSIRELMTNPELTNELRHRSFRALTAGEVAPLVCACCRKGVYISMLNHRNALAPYFKHFNGQGLDCPWVTGDTTNERAVRALQYRGRQVSPRHDQLVRELKSMLEADPSISEVAIERYCRPSLCEGHGRFPDVYAEHLDGRRFAFELQLSTTLLLEITGRRAFYLAEGIQLFWVMDRKAVGLDRTAFHDVIHDHSLDVFLVDEDLAESARTKKRFRLGRKALRGEVFESRRDFGLDDVTFTGRALPFVEDGLTPAFISKAQFQRTELFEWLRAEQPVRKNWSACERLTVPESLDRDWQLLSRDEQFNLASLMAVVFTCCQAAKNRHLSGSDFVNYDTRENSLSAVLNSFCSAPERAPLVALLSKTVEVVKLRDYLKETTLKHLDEAVRTDLPVTSVGAALLAHFFGEVHDQAIREALETRHSES
jgi:hypothetical protein